MTRGKVPPLALVYPAPVVSGVGDYAAELFSDLNYPANVTRIITAGAQGDRIRDVISVIRQVRALPTGTTVHCEVSAGSIAPFWAAVAAKDRATGTVHDAPQPVWWPGRTRFLAEHKMLMHLLHYPLRRLVERLQLWALAEVSLVSLSAAGRDVMAGRGYATEYVPHFVYPADALTIQPIDRPRSVGIFGHNYGGKGWDDLRAFREMLPGDIGIVVGGIGTESLPRIDGIQYRGAIPAAELRDFFASFRVLLLPYNTNSRYGRFFSASGVLARAYAYGVPALATEDRNFPEEASCGLLRLTGPRPNDWANDVLNLVDNPDALAAMVVAQREAAQERSLLNTRAVYEALWSRTTD
jgi:hypothetical protein